MSENVFLKLSLSFNWQERLKREMPFIQSFIDKTDGKKVCDLGGGIGMHALYLQEKGYDVVLVDKDEDSLKVAEEKGVKNVICSTFLRFQEKVKNQDFIMSIGNGIAALNKDEFEYFAKHCYKSLNKNGKFFCQILNFDAMNKKDYHVIASRFQDDEHQLRFAEPFNDNFLEMHFVSTNQDTGDVKISRHYFNNHFKENIIVAGKKAGFTDIAFFGTYNGAPHSSEEGQDTIFIFSK